MKGITRRTTSRYPRKDKKRKLKLFDVRLSGGDDTRVIAAPEWAFERSEFSLTYYRNDAAWSAIESARTRRKKANEAQVKAHKAEMAATAEEWGKTLNESDPDSTEHKMAEIRLMGYYAMKSQPEEKPAPTYSLYYVDWSNHHTCLVCKKGFFGMCGVTLCSDACVKERHKETRTRGNPTPRRVVHAVMKCGHCSVEFMPTRKDALFCSVRCRVANHREAGE